MNELFSTRNYFSILLISNLLSSYFNIIGDCDETFNYWEPTHYLLYGFGMQTWEYSSEFALRSYAYLSLHAFPLWILNYFFQIEKITLFYILRCILGIFSAYCQSKFVFAIEKKFSRKIAFSTMLFLIFSPGMFISNTAYLASSFSMYCITLAIAFWMNNQYLSTILITFISSMLGWPFASFALLPTGLHIIFTTQVLKTIQYGTMALLFVVLPVLLIDSWFYQRFVFASYNIVQYNVLDQSTSSELYGVAPFSFYIKNLLLNFNFAFVLALFVPLTLLFDAKRRHLLLYLLPLFLWFAAMMPQPHKEERFLFVVYPMICLSAAVVVQKLPQSLKTVVMLLFITMSTSRIISISMNYKAPLNVWQQFSNLTMNDKTTTKTNVCVGQEWHRFPTSFFLPHRNTSLQYIDSGFTGLLPKSFEPFPQGIREPATGMNKFNREDKSRYIDVSKCDYLIHLIHHSQSLPNPYWQFNNAKWIEIYGESFVDRSTPMSHNTNGKLFALSRLFYIPFFTEKLHLQKKNYVLLKRIDEE